MTATATPFTALPLDAGPDKTPLIQSPLAATLASTIQLGAATQHRNLQLAVGASEVGKECDRQLAWQLYRRDGVNLSPDPTRSLMGTGMHLVLQEMFQRLDGGSGRYLTEVRITYRGVPGQVDLYDTYLGEVIDWKTTSKARIADYIKNGPPQSYQIQVQIYAAGLAALGFHAREVALAFLPYDGALSGLWTWQAPVDRSIADVAIDRLERLTLCDPDDVDVTPTRMCAYCPYYNPKAIDTSDGCSAQKGKTR